MLNVVIGIALIGFFGWVAWVIVGVMLIMRMGEKPMISRGELFDQPWWMLWRLIKVETAQGGLFFRLNLWLLTATLQLCYQKYFELTASIIADGSEVGFYLVLAFVSVVVRFEKQRPFEFETYEEQQERFKEC